MKNNIFFLPKDIQNIIKLFLYDNKKTIIKNKILWNKKNKKQLIIFDKINIP